jgi:DNA-binding MarR family transcriptional regulator
MDMNTMTDVMRRLERKGWVDRGPDYMDFSYRVLVTAAGRVLLEDARPAIAAFVRDLRVAPASR